MKLEMATGKWLVTAENCASQVNLNMELINKNYLVKIFLKIKPHILKGTHSASNA